MWYVSLLVIDVLLAICIVTLILLHRGRGADVGVAFGGGSSGTVFGAKGATSFLGKLIAGLSAAFLINSLLLAYIANRDFMDQGIIEQIESMPATTEQMEENTADGMEQSDENGTSSSAPEIPN